MGYSCLRLKFVMHDLSFLGIYFLIIFGIKSLGQMFYQKFTSKFMDQITGECFGYRIFAPIIYLMQEKQI